MSTNNNLRNLMIAAIGIVYGDIGTSPLYALKSSFIIGNVPVVYDNIMGIISLFLWSLILIVSVKYVGIVLRINNHGEGGILVLSSIAEKLHFTKYKSIPVFLGILGTALFFGDGIITPAISVLGALEGLKLVSPIFNDYIVYLALIVLTLLFMFQKQGTEKIGFIFGPIMILWFITIFGIGLYNIIIIPEILKSFNPYYAIKFLLDNGNAGLKTIGGIILVVTGVEALYADIGHFGRRPIELSWHCLVFPALAINYLGQGALLLKSATAIENPFYLLIPQVGLYPLIILSTLATIIASQAVITGIFSISWQAIMLNYFPRMQVIYTSYNNMGQVYVPVINFILYVLTVLIVCKFETSDSLSVAYGLSVSAVMLITTALVVLIAYDKWKWKLWWIVSLFTPLMLIELAFSFTNVIKILEGAWITILISIVISYFILVWIRGNKLTQHYKFPGQENLENFIKEYKAKYAEKIPETAIFLSRYPKEVPDALHIHLQHNKLLHKKTLFISLVIIGDPKVVGYDRFFFTKLDDEVYSISADYGFKEIPDFDKIINWAYANGILSQDEEISFYLSKGVAVPSDHSSLNKISEKIYIFLSNNAISAYEFYKIPHSKVLELGVWHQV